jgi:CxC6 like cysteine cluster associated with KDZ transposases
MCQVVVGDGLSMGRPCCGVFRCTEPLQNNRHRFCKTHFNDHNICAIIGCVNPTSDGSKTCSDKEHKALEKKNKEHGAAAFTLKERLRKTQFSHPTESISITTDESLPTHATESEWFDVDPEGNVTVAPVTPGSIGIADDTAEPCPSKSGTGNRKIKAQFGRRRTHNEQTLVRPCGIIFARATFFGAEAVSNFLVSVSTFRFLLYLLAGNVSKCILCPWSKEARAYFL